MTISAKERIEQTQSPGTQKQGVHGNEGANRRFLESMERHEREHEERKRELQKIKEGLPEDKERLDIDRLNERLRGLYEYIKTPRMIEGFEIEYYLDRPEIKTTDEFVDFIIKTRGRA